MLLLINRDNQHMHLKTLASMHHLRKRVFKDVCNWPVNVINGMEFDQFDTENAHYLVHLDESGKVNGCTRLISTIHPYLLGDIYPELIASGNPPKQSDIWETTRFCGDPENAPKNIVGILAAGMLEFALKSGIKEYVSISDIRIERIIKKFGWIPQRLGKVIRTTSEMSAGESFVVKTNTYREVLLKSGIGQIEVIQNWHEFQDKPEEKVA